MTSMSPRPHFVYIVQCVDGTYYTGIAIDLFKRIAAHNSGKGARYTRSRRPVVLRWAITCPSRSIAAHFEARIKTFTKSVKRRLIEGEAWLVHDRYEKVSIIHDSYANSREVSMSIETEEGSKWECLSGLPEMMIGASTGRLLSQRKTGGSFGNNARESVRRLSRTPRKWE